MDIDFFISKINGFDVTGLESFQQVDLLNRSQGPIVIELMKKSQSLNTQTDANLTSSLLEATSNDPYKVHSKNHDLYSNYPDSTYSSLNYDTNENFEKNAIDGEIRDLGQCLEEFSLLDQNYGVEYEIIDLRKNIVEEYLGFTLFYLEKGEDDTLVFVSKIENEGIAYNDSRLQEGDQILKINDHTISSKETALKALKQQILEFRIEIARPKFVAQKPLFNYNDEYLDNVCPAFKAETDCLDPIFEIFNEDDYNLESAIHNISQLSPHTSLQNICHKSPSLSSTSSRKCTSLRSKGKDSGFEVKLTDEDESFSEPNDHYQLSSKGHTNFPPPAFPSSNVLNHTYEDPNQLLALNRTQTSISLGHDYESLVDVVTRCESTPNSISVRDNAILNKNINQDLSMKYELTCNSSSQNIERSNHKNEATCLRKSANRFLEVDNSMLNGPTEKSLKNTEGSYPDVMYTNAQNLHHTISLQQLLFKNALKNEKNNDSSTSPPNFNKKERVLNHHEKVELESIPNQYENYMVKMKWKIKRRSDGTRYIVRRPLEDINQVSSKTAIDIGKVNKVSNKQYNEFQRTKRKETKGQRISKTSHNHTLNPILTVTTV